MEKLLTSTPSAWAECDDYSILTPNSVLSSELLLLTHPLPDANIAFNNPGQFFFVFLLLLSLFLFPSLPFYLFPAIKSPFLPDSSFVGRSVSRPSEYTPQILENEIVVIRRGLHQGTFLFSFSHLFLSSFSSLSLSICPQRHHSKSYR